MVNYRRILVCLLFVTALLFWAGESARGNGAPDRQYRAADANSCQWVEKAPDRVRSPIQMDIHAGYRIFVFQSDGTIGYRVRGEFPFAAFLSFTIYDGVMLHAALLDYRIEPDPDSTNPFRPGALVNAPDRSFTVTVLPDGAVPDASMPNPIFMPPAPRHSNVVTVVLVQRVYLPEPGQNRFGGDAPTIEPFEVSSPTTPAACPSGDFTAIIDQFGSLGINFSQSPLPRNNKIEFYRPPALDVPFADGSSLMTKHDCTSYLMATVLPDKLAVIHLPAVPLFFDNTNITETTTFEEPQGVRYLSLGSYGASWLSIEENENVAGPDIQTRSDGSADFVAIPIRMWLEDTQGVKEIAGERGYNVMPLADNGPLIEFDVNSPQINPFLIYRNKVATNGFAGDIQNVPCFQGTSFGHAPRVYSASPANMGDYAPIGVECTLSDFLNGDCGQNFSY